VVFARTAPGGAIRTSPGTAPNMPAAGSTTTVRWSPLAASVIRPHSSSVKTSGPATFRVPRSGAPTATSATAFATSAEAIGCTGVPGSRTVSPSAVQDRTASANSKNWVARTIEYGTGPAFRISSCSTLAR
jgi:hypothetical protein